MTKMTPKEIRQQEIYRALLFIAEMGQRMKPEVIDWAQVGKNAVHAAQEAISGRCEKCGRPNPYIGKRAL